MALASKVEELSQYRSEFFGELRKALGDREDVRIVGDRFVFQSEVLFASGSDVIEPGGPRRAGQARGRAQGDHRPDPDRPALGAAGRRPHRPASRSARRASRRNWELSTARAIAVAQFLVSQGIPPDRVAARGFAEFQPLDPGQTEAAYRRNRRIEIKLTTR